MGTGSGLLMWSWEGYRAHSPYLCMSKLNSYCPWLSPPGPPGLQAPGPQLLSHLGPSRAALLGFPDHASDHHTGQALCLGHSLLPPVSPSLGSLPNILQISADSALPAKTFSGHQISLEHWPLYGVFSFRAVIQFMWAPSCLREEPQLFVLS